MSVIRSLLKRPSAVIGLLLIAAFMLTAGLAPLLPVPDPLPVSITTRLLPPGGEYLLGTDSFGRDLLSRMIGGARVSLLVGVLSVLVGAGLGVLIGLTAGLGGRVIDNVLMRTMDIVLAFPALILAMSIAAALGPNLQNAILAVALVSTPRYARLVRSSVLKLKETEFVEAAHALGANRLRIAFRHVLSNAIGPVIVQATLGFGQAIVTVAGLSFIGLGAQPPQPEWGAIITEGRYYVLSGRWWLSVFPGLAIALTVLGFNLVGDELRDRLDPRST